MLVASGRRMEIGADRWVFLSRGDHPGETGEFLLKFALPFG
jgi:hypothetical protein